MREDEAGGACAKEKHFHADGRIELVKAVNSARGGFEKRRLFVSQVVDLITLLLVAVRQSNRQCMLIHGWGRRLLDDVVGKAAVLGDTPCIEVLAEERLAAAAEEAVVALRTSVWTTSP